MMKLDYIFITHLHADHILGIPGLLETMAFQGRRDPVTIVGPVGTTRVVDLFNQIGYYTLKFPVRVIELEPGDVVEMDGYGVTALKTVHSVPSLGYCLKEDQRPGRFDRPKAIELGVLPGPLFGRLQRGETVEIEGKIVRSEDVMGPPRPGRKLIYTGDSRPTEEVKCASQEADLLIHDGSLADEMEKWALETMHSTSGEAAKLAKQAKVKKLVLTHISSRYSDDVQPLLDDALRHFPDTVIATDLMKLDIKLK